jgi:hypothetical protein
MAFLTPDDLKTHIYGEVVEAITDGDEDILPTAIAAAIGEAKGYMSRYDYETIFASEGDTKDPILLLYVKSMAKWHFIQLANPNIDYEDTKTRYEMATKWLDKIQAGKIVPPSWPLKNNPVEESTFFHVKSNPKRGTHR